MIGQIQSKSAAQVFSDYLYVQGIENQIEAERDGRWGIWVHADEELERASGMLTNFVANPSNPIYLKPAQEARKLREQEESAQVAFRKRYRDRSQIFPSLAAYGLGVATLVFIAISIVVFSFSYFESTIHLTRWFYISEYDLIGGHNYRLSGLTEVAHGQVWRLFTPMFLHFGILHILFNMLWLRDLGGMIEGRQGTGFLIGMVLAISGVSNVAEYLVTGPGFGGMSGVVYGLLGYIWIRGKFDPASGLFLHPTTVSMMIIWYFLCLSGFLGHIANTVHTAGLLMGMTWGYIAGVVRR